MYVAKQLKERVEELQEEQLVELEELLPRMLGPGYLPNPS